MADRDDFKLVDVLLVEDDEGDILMTREAFEFHKIRNPLHVVTDGEQALHFMRRTGPFADAPRPGLILLDVNLPRLSGLEVLAALKQDPELAVLPVVMLTTSQAEEDILRSYKLHANAASCRNPAPVPELAASAAAPFGRCGSHPAWKRGWSPSTAGPTSRSKWKRAAGRPATSADSAAWPASTTSPSTSRSPRTTADRRRRRTG